MNLPKTSRRRFLQAGGAGLLNFAVPGLVVGKDKFDDSGQAVSSKKCCIFVLLCGGPSHVDTWDLKPEAPIEIRGPYKPIRTKVPGMQLSELHPMLAKVTDQFCLIRSMTHPPPDQQSLRRHAQPAERPGGRAGEAGRSRRPAVHRVGRGEKPLE